MILFSRSLPAISIRLLCSGHFPSAISSKFEWLVGKRMCILSMYNIILCLHIDYNIMPHMQYNILPHMEYNIMPHMEYNIMPTHGV